MCIWTTTGTAASSDACPYDETASNVSFDEALENCPLTWGTPTISCDPVDLGTLTYSVSCTGYCPDPPAPLPPAPPSTNLALTIDPARSFLRLGTPVGTTTFTLSGRGWADTAGTRTIAGAASASSGRVAGSDYSQWSLSFQNAIQVPVTGDTFRIPAATRPTIVGTGLRDGLPKKLHAVLGHDAVGHLRPATRTWNLDYADSSTAGTLTLHLEGALAPASGGAR
jgi:hypothetical protein